ncbi:MAG TPA: GGDEF domain-containing protein [Anaerolineae bacterium]|nr:GGDEF domain-containing protein [Anaerolineae bacterium]
MDHSKLKKAQLIEEIEALQEKIAELERDEEQLVYTATHDLLTGLPNRTLFDDRLNLALARAYRYHQKLAVMSLNLDHFKDVNDTLGHKAGDRLLQAVGERLTGLLRRSDTVARTGGDDFMLVIPELGRVEDAAEVARKILDALRKPFVLDDHELAITASIGIAIYPYDGEDADTLMRNADIAMRRAKNQGGDNHQRYIPVMKAEAST